MNAAGRQSARRQRSREARDYLKATVLPLESFTSAHCLRIRLLTESGSELVSEVQDGPVQAVAERAAEGLSPEQYDALLGSLEQVATNLGWLGDRPGRDTP